VLSDEHGQWLIGWWLDVRGHGPAGGRSQLGQADRATSADGAHWILRYAEEHADGVHGRISPKVGLAVASDRTEHEQDYEHEHEVH